MTPNCLVLRHVVHEHLGLFAPILAEHGVRYEYSDPGMDLVHRRLPAKLDEADGLVVLGGPMNVDETARYPFLAQEVEAIQAAIDRQIPVLGVCLGSQLIAKALGARVYRNPVKEIGWGEVSATPEASQDRLFRVFQPTETVFQWHGDVFDLPRRATLLALSRACPHQAFRYGTSVYGLLFHLEVDRGELEEWLRQPEMAAEAREASVLDDITVRSGDHLPRLGGLARDVFGAFCALIDERASSLR